MIDRKMNRREFMQTSAKATGAFAVGGTGLSLMSSCAVMQPLKHEGPVTYPKLAEYKIQSPEHYGVGQKCMVGLWLGMSYEYINAKSMVQHYIEKIGKPISFYILPYRVGMSSQVCTGNNERLLKNMHEIGEMGVIPFITFEVRKSYELGSTMSQVTAGKCDSYIRESAKEYKEYGEKHGGFFIRTFREMNMPQSHAWAGSPSSMTKAWIHIWSIFEDEGANKYATWVFNPYATVSYSQNWQTYYPGDKYVDWIGLNGYSVPTSHGRYGFYSLFADSLSIARQNYPSKPLMIAEVGTAVSWGKGSWQKGAFSEVKQLQSIKGLAWWSENWKARNINKDFDTRIDSSSSALEGFREGISDPYFLGTVPYQSM